MKKCANCNQIFSTDEAFCVQCGTPLITHFDGVTNPSNSASFSRFSVPLEQTTQVVSQPTYGGQSAPPVFYPTPPPQAAPGVKKDSKWMYLVVGALAAAVFTMGLFFMFSRNADEKASNENANWTKVNSASRDESSGTNTQTTTVKTPKPENTSVRERPTETPFVPKSDPPPRNFSRNYWGTVSSDNIEMRLTRNGSSIYGKVIPQDRYADISVYGSIDNEGNFTMNEYSDIGVITGVYNGRISGNTISGTWSKPDGTRSRRLFLRSN